MKRQGYLPIVALFAVFASLLDVVGERAAQASEPQTLAEVTIQYVNQDGASTVSVSPDGTLAAFLLYDAITSYDTPARLAAVRLVDLTNPTRDETISVSGALGWYWLGDSPLRFSRDSSSLFVPLDDGIVIIDTGTFAVRTTRIPPLFDFSLRISPSIEYYSVFEYSDSFFPSLIITETETGQVVFAQEFPLGDVSFSEFTPTAHVVVDQGVVALPLNDSGVEGFVDFSQDTLPGVPRRVSKESPSGNILAIGLQDMQDFSDAGVAFVDLSDGTIRATFETVSDETFVDVAAFSPDEEFVLVRSVTLAGIPELYVVNLSTGDATVWDDPLVAPLAAVERFFPSPNHLVGWNNAEQAFVFADLAETTVSVNPSLNTSGGYTFRQPVVYVADTDEVVLSWEDSDYNNWEFGEWPSVLPSGTITVKWVFDKVALSPDATEALRANAIGFDAAGTTLVGFSWRNGTTLTVWDTGPFGEPESFVLSSFQGGSTENSYEYWNPVSMGSGALKVSPDGQSAYIAFNQSVYFFDIDQTIVTGVVFSVSTVTGDVQEIARFENASIDAVDYHQSATTIIVGVVEESEQEPWERPMTVVEVDVTSGAVSTLTTLEQGVSEIAKLSQGTVAATRYGALSVTSIPTGSSVGRVIFGSGNITATHFSADGTGVVGIERVETYGDSGRQEFAGGTVYGAQVPSGSTSGDARSLPITRWSGSTGGAGAFLVDGGMFVFYADGQFEAFQNPDFSPIGVAKALGDIPTNQFVTAMVADPTGQTLWLGFGDTESPSFFVPVAIPDFLETSAAELAGPGGVVARLFDLNPQWLIPAALFGALLAGLGVWLGLLRRREKSVSLGGVP